MRGVDEECTASAKMVSGERNGRVQRSETSKSLTQPQTVSKTMKHERKGETMNQYPIIANCNFESRDDTTIHDIRLAIESGLTRDSNLIETMDTLESTLTEHAETNSVGAVEACDAAESNVLAAWTTAVQEDVEDARQERYVD